MTDPEGRGAIEYVPGFAWRPRLCANCCSFLWLVRIKLVHVPPGYTWDVFHRKCQVLPPKERWRI